MRPSALILAIALAAGGPAAAQQAPPPNQARTVPVAPPAPAPVRPSQSFATGGIGGGLTGLQPLRPFGNGMVGLAPAGDQAPLCRATCTKAHNLCSSAGDDDCDTRWSQCVATCRAAR
ncbi:MAG TPA: hypothetical protein VL460_03990 [Caulobacteraceae bacterium]|jgi:hypothetical protein|nr:hypothetical protein [Caulobacteraceae bacterium]